jgi:hypothetical protein
MSSALLRLALSLLLPLLLLSTTAGAISTGRQC